MGAQRDDQRSAIGRFGALSAEHFAVGKPCVVCHEPLAVGDVPSIISLAPATPEDNRKWKEGLAYTAKAGVSHERCAWPGEGA